MPSFISDITPEQLVDDILWYVTNGTCTITQELIHTAPVQTINQLGAAPTNGSDDEDESYEEDDEASAAEYESFPVDEDDLTPELTEQQRALPTPSPAPRALSVTIIDEIQTALYERGNLELAWLNQEQKQDPVTKREVTGLHDAQDIPVAELDLTFTLHKLTWFIKSRLLPLQEHIAQGNIAELRAWLTAWGLAAVNYESLNDRKPQEYQASKASIFSDRNIILPNGKSLLENAALSEHATEMLSMLKNEFQMEYKPTTYQLFMQFLQAVAGLGDSNSALCLLEFNKVLGSDPTAAQLEKFFTNPVLGMSSDVIDKESHPHIGLYPLQLASLLGNAPAVSMMISLGAKLRSFTVDFRESDDWSTVDKRLKSEIVLAIDSNSIATFVALKPLYVPGQFRYLLNVAVHYICCVDKPEFLDCLQQQFAVPVNHMELLDAVIYFNAVKTFKLMLEQQPETFQTTTLEELASPMDVLLGKLTTGPDAETTQDIARIILLLLPYVPANLYEYAEEIEVELPLEVQVAFMRSHAALTLMERIMDVRVKRYIGGQLTESFLSNEEFFRPIIYRALYARHDLIQRLEASGRTREFIQVIAIADRLKGEFGAEHIVATATQICDSAERFVTAGSTCVLFAAKRARGSDDPDTSTASSSCTHAMR